MQMQNSDSVAMTSGAASQPSSTQSSGGGGKDIDARRRRQSEQCDEIGVAIGRVDGRISLLERTLARADADLAEEHEALERNNITKQHYLHNLFVYYLRWLSREIGATSDVASQVYFCVARHMNKVLRATQHENGYAMVNVMGDDIEVAAIINAFQRHRFDRNLKTDVTLEKYLETHAEGVSTFVLDAYVAQYENDPDSMPLLEMQLPLKEFAERLAAVDVALLDTYTLETGMRGVKAFAINKDSGEKNTTAAAVTVHFDDVQRGKPIFWPRGHAIGNQMLREFNLVPGKKPLRPGDDGYADKPFKMIVTQI